MKNQKYFPILDPGHGGMNQNAYTTGNKKRYKFTDGYEVFEGVINRLITLKLMDLLRAHGVAFYDTMQTDFNTDVPLSKRVAKSDQIYAQNKGAYLLSIHSNSVSKSIAGPGSKAVGDEIYTSKGITRSDYLVPCFYDAYRKAFPSRVFRVNAPGKLNVDKEADFYVLKRTKCPALLVENGFFDNREEAEFLMSKKGQYGYAMCLFNAILDVEKSNPLNL